jgi:hypothetical protein
MRTILICAGGGGAVGRQTAGREGREGREGFAKDAKKIQWAFFCFLRVVCTVSGPLSWRFF